MNCRSELGFLEWFWDCTKYLIFFPDRVPWKIDCTSSLYLENSRLHKIQNSWAFLSLFSTEISEEISKYHNFWNIKKYSTQTKLKIFYTENMQMIYFPHFWFSRPSPVISKRLFNNNVARNFINKVMEEQKNGKKSWTLFWFSGPFNFSCFLLCFFRDCSSTLEA